MIEEPLDNIEKEFVNIIHPSFPNQINASTKLLF